MGKYELDIQGNNVKVAVVDRSNHHGFSSCNLLDENFTETRFVIELILHAEPEIQQHRKTNKVSHEFSRQH